jgi:uncharacterized repeat protein (TIGR01451 family)
MAAAAQVESGATDIVVTTLASHAQIRLGQQVTLTAIVTNRGPLPATDVVVANPLPTSLTIVSQSSSVGRHDAGLASWSVGALAVGETASLTLVVRAQARGQVTYPAALVASSPMDGNDLNNVDSARIEILLPLADLAAQTTAAADEWADLEVTTDVVPDQVEPGEVVTATMTVTNLGQTEASTVEAAVLESPGAIIVDSSSTTAFDRTRRVWTIGTLGPGQSATLMLQQQVTRPGLTINTVALIQTGTPDPDLNNNAVYGVVQEPSADLVVFAGADVARVGIGGEVVFSVVVTNIGPNTAHGVSVINMLASQLSLVEASATVASYDPATGVWAIGELAPGEIQTLSIRAIAGWSGDVRGHSVITSTSPTESNRGNNSVESSLTIVAAPEAAAPGTRPGGLAAHGELGWWLTGSGAIGLFLVLAGATLVLARRRDPLSDL